MGDDDVPVDAYSVTLERLSVEDGGGYAARVPELAGCLATGETAEEALAEIRDAIRSWVLTAREFGDVVPPPASQVAYSGKWVQRVPKSLHRRLVDRARTEGVSLNQLATALLAEGVGAPQTAARRPRRVAGR
ncbi:MAG: type II toxin-antitoxin system HicB family antitoxin [Rhodospirillales bacterium]|nr:MAG: type II toxin-antitoxin system HicB family antitoxin [Rhodospirillales bacterium]